MTSTQTPTPTPAPLGGTQKPKAGQPTWLIAAIGLIGGVVLTLGAQQAASSWKAYQAKPETFLARNRSGDSSIKETASGLQYKVLKPGVGAKPGDGDVALITYEGKLTNGTTFDKSEQPTPLQVAGVVPGFSEGLKLMQRGGKYRLWIKPTLGYGDKAAGPIPANSVLVFDVDLLDFKSEAEIREIQRAQQAGGSAGPPPAGPAVP